MYTQNFMGCKSEIVDRIINDYVYGTYPIHPLAEYCVGPLINIQKRWYMINVEIMTYRGAGLESYMDSLHKESSNIWREYQLCTKGRRRTDIMNIFPGLYYRMGSNEIITFRMGGGGEKHIYPDNYMDI